MNWTELLNTRLTDVARATNGLLDLVEEDRLDWKPGGGADWMSTGQLLEHLTNACGVVAEGFVTGNWSFMTGGEGENAMPPGTPMPSATSIADARARIAKDCELTRSVIEQAGEEALGTRMLPAPWNPEERLLAVQILECIDHLASHKAQLFYYLKLQGKPVHTGTLWGLELPDAPPPL